MNRLYASAVALGLVLLAWPAHARVVEKIAALVGDDLILQSEVEDRATPLLADIASISNPSERDARINAIRREEQDASGVKLRALTDVADQVVSAGLAGH